MRTEEEIKNVIMNHEEEPWDEEVFTYACFREMVGYYTQSENTFPIEGLEQRRALSMYLLLKTPHGAEVVKKENTMRSLYLTADTAMRLPLWHAQELCRTWEMWLLLPPKHRANAIMSIELDIEEAANSFCRGIRNYLVGRSYFKWALAECGCPETILSTFNSYSDVRDEDIKRMFSLWRKVLKQYKSVMGVEITTIKFPCLSKTEDKAIHKEVVENLNDLYQLTLGMTQSKFYDLYDPITISYGRENGQNSKDYKA